MTSNNQIQSVEAEPTTIVRWPNAPDHTSKLDQMTMRINNMCLIYRSNRPAVQDKQGKKQVWWGSNGSISDPEGKTGQILHLLIWVCPKTWGAPIYGHESSGKKWWPSNCHKTFPLNVKTAAYQSNDPNDPHLCLGNRGFAIDLASVFRAATWIHPHLSLCVGYYVRNWVPIYDVYMNMYICMDLCICMYNYHTCISVHVYPM